MWPGLLSYVSWCPLDARLSGWPAPQSTSWGATASDFGLVTSLQTCAFMEGVYVIDNPTSKDELKVSEGRSVWGHKGQVMLL